MLCSAVPNVSVSMCVTVRCVWVCVQCTCAVWYVKYGVRGMSHLQSIADLTRQRLEVVKIFVSGHLMSFTVVSLAIKLRIRWQSFVLVLVCFCFFSKKIHLCCSEGSV